MKKARHFVVGDIHGGYRALVQVLKKVNFDYEIDTLTSLGDLVDGWPESFEVVEELLKIKNLNKIRGNHDEVFREYLETGVNQMGWLHGGDSTLRSYVNHADREVKMWPEMGSWETTLTRADIPKTHLAFFNEQVNYHIQDDNVFVHGGFDRHLPLEEQRADFVYYWDRGLFKEAFADSRSIRKFKMKFQEKWIKKVFIGHSATTNYEITTPMFLDKIVNLDTACGYGYGRLTLMNVDTLEYVQSDKLKDLYPTDKGR